MPSEKERELMDSLAAEMQKRGFTINKPSIQDTVEEELRQKLAAAELFDKYETLQERMEYLNRREAYGP